MPFLALAGIPYKYNQCHTILEGFSSVCAKLEPAGSKNNEITEINVLQKFTPHALCRACFDFVSIVLKYLSFPIPVSNRTSKLGSDSFHSHLSFKAAYSLKSEKVWPPDFATL